ncbi:hypothetical protein FRC19_011333 [Serendipita sp. 401]|nr:hypothetical protein FRC18_011409 [Serendipita sp. 400]KAG8825479.1 hypothetical protein FRC19_011333 [Serendipita sp. 401]KAG8879443.1 hypothetical protein FRC20_000015 [Serendipita sp. 405]KAG9057402.1 hypothetical protein FS842_006880 [Serendipita sp. 407]
MSLKAAGLGVAGVVALTAAIASLWLHPVLTVFGLLRPVDNIGTGSCTTLPELPACEKMVLHKGSGLLYLSCSTIQSRTLWCPAVDHLAKAKPVSDMDYFAIVDTSKPLSPSAVTIPKITGLPTHDPTFRGLNFVGLDVVESSTEPGHLWVYVINHRPPLPPLKAQTYGADSCVEIFKTKIGSDTLEHVRTIEDPEHLVTPNDIVGKDDGSGFWVTNDHVVRVGLKRKIESFFVLEGVGITYCSVTNGCKLAITGLPSMNGIVRATPSRYTMNQDLVYAAGYALNDKIYVMERESDDSLILIDSVSTGYAIDNLSIDDQGSLIFATFPRPLDWALGYIEAPETFISPSSVHKMTLNPDSYFGDKYKIEKIFENNGTIISGATTAVSSNHLHTLWINGALVVIAEGTALTDAHRDC